MNALEKISSFFTVCACSAVLFTSCSSAKTSLPKIDMTAWNYDESDDVFWQVGISYAATPADAGYETLGIYVPGKYFNATENADGTYTVKVNKRGEVAGLTVKTAPFVMPIQTPGYSALEAPSGYQEEVSQYTKNGFIFVYAGARGRDHGIPSAITDFKAAVRYVRYNASLLPGNTERFFTFGMSGGGAQSALMGATGDAKEFEPYLKAIGAVEGVSDAIMGSMDWCPITNLNVADAAYEWELGGARTDLDESTKALSNSLSVKFAEYINSLGLKDGDGNVLTLEQSEDGLYHAGSYYEYLKKTIEKSLNDFLSDTEFPYNAENQKQALGNNMMMTGGFPPHGMGEGQPERGNPPAAEDLDGVKRGKGESNNVDLSGTYNTVEEYIAALNENEEWVNYDKETNTATITSVEAFMRNVKQLQKSVGAFDDLSGTQPENTLFGFGDGKGVHFDSLMTEALKATENEKADEYASDLAKKDALGSTMEERHNMYNPMYYLSSGYKGFKTSTPAKYWRIHAGIFQGDTAISTEMDYYLALVNYGSKVKSVEFSDVWGLYHTEAERPTYGDGTSTGNFIQWVKECLSLEK